MDFGKFVKLLSSGSIAEISLTDHVKLRLQERNIRPSLVEDVLLNRWKDLRGVEQQGESRFKLMYLHPEMDDMDLIIVVEGLERDIDAFLRDLKSRHPPLARIEKIEKKEILPQGFDRFYIEKSSKGGSGGVSSAFEQEG